jgi:hypothetical protein
MPPSRIALHFQQLINPARAIELTFFGCKKGGGDLSINRSKDASVLMSSDVILLLPVRHPPLRLYVLLPVLAFYVLALVQLQKWKPIVSHWQIFALPFWQIPPHR